MEAGSKREDLLFKALADPTRRRILMQLSQQPQPVNEIASQFRISRPAISKHLRILREAKLVGVDRCGKENLYHIAPDTFDDALRWLSGFWFVRLTLLKQLAERKS